MYVCFPHNASIIERKFTRRNWKRNQSSYRKTVSRLFLFSSSCFVHFLIADTQPLHSRVVLYVFSTLQLIGRMLESSGRKFAASTARSVPALIKELSANPSVPMFQFKNFQRCFHPLIYFARIIIYRHTQN